MAYLELHFSASERPELERSSFLHPAVGGPLNAVRGRHATEPFGSDSFIWTPAVKALSILLIKSALDTESLNKSAADACISGEGGSPAATLDYAIGRGAAWIIALFGCSADGRQFAARLFVRNNPERKRPGPVTITLNPRQLSPKDISILQNGTRLHLRQMQDLLESLSTPPGPSPLSCASSEAHARLEDGATQHLQDALFGLFNEEIATVLRRFEIFGKRRYIRTIESINENPSLIRLAGKDAVRLSGIDLELSASEMNGLCPLVTSAALRTRETPIVIGCTPSHTAVVALARYLRDGLSLPVLANYCFAHSSELIKGMVDETPGFPDACVLSTASYAALISSGKKTGFMPLMILPSSTHTIITPKGGSESSLNRGEYALLSDIPSTPGFLLDRLFETGLVAKSRVSITHADPSEAAEALAGGDKNLKAIVWFPHAPLNLLLNDCCQLRPNAGSAIYPENILLVREPLFRQKALMRELCISIRDAWLTLGMERKPLARTVRSMLEDQEYHRAMTRFSGVHHMRRGTLAETAHKQPSAPAAL